MMTIMRRAFSFPEPLSLKLSLKLSLGLKLLYLLPVLAGMDELVVGYSLGCLQGAVVQWGRKAG